MKTAILSFALLVAGTFLFCSFTQNNEDNTDCRFTYLRVYDFTMKTIEVSNVFKVAPSYTPPAGRYQCSLYTDSAEAERARTNAIHSARNARYQVQLSLQKDQCHK